MATAMASFCPAANRRRSERTPLYRHTKAATFIRATLHRYSAFAFVQRNLKVADMLIGAALFNARQTGLDKQPAVQENSPRWRSIVKRSTRT